MKYISSILLLCLCFTFSNAQVWKWGRATRNIGSDFLFSAKITVDPYRNAYIGSTAECSTPGYFVWGTDSVHHSLNRHAVVACVDSGGNRRWIITPQGSRSHLCDMEADACGNIYVLGIYLAGTLTFGSHSVTYSYSSTYHQMYFLAKLNSNGNVLWLKNVGLAASGYSDVNIAGLCIDKFGNPYVAGVFNWGSVSIGATTLTNSSSDTNSADIFVAKYNSSGALQWAKSFGGDSSDYVSSISAGINGGIYLGGLCWSDSIAFGADTLTKPYDTTRPFLYVAMIDAAGNARWGRQSPGQMYDRMSSMATDGRNNLYLSGGYIGAFSFGGFSLPPASYSRNFLVKFDSTGTTKWVKTLNGSTSYQMGSGVDVDKWGKVWMCGGGSSISERMFLARYDTSGAFIDSTSFGNGTASDLAIDNRGNLFLGGPYLRAFMLGPDSLSLYGGYDVPLFVGKYSYPFYFYPIDTLPPITICAGSTTTLTGNLLCGKWKSSNVLVATIDTFSGLLTGVSAGTTTITYDGGKAGYEIGVVHVNPSPTPIGGVTNICVGTSVSLTSTPLGGSWSSSDAGVAPISSSGVVTGATAGTSVISYTYAGCSAVDTIEVFSTLPSIAGTTNICLGASTSLTNSVSGGSWTALPPGFISINPVTGSVNTITPGVATITYSLGGGCIAISLLTVNDTPHAIIGDSLICMGETITFTNITPGGTWNSSATGIASISASGVVSAGSTGIATISYTTGGICNIVESVTVNAMPSAISGQDSVCVGDTTLLTNGLSGGTWSSSVVSIANIMPSGKLVGVSPGTSIISYNRLSCIVTDTVQVNVIPSAIVGPDTICIGDTVLLTDSVMGGMWSSSNTSVANILTSGNITGISVGTAIITYDRMGCLATASVRIIKCLTNISDPSEVEFDVYPNPTANTLMIRSDTKLFDIEITNLLGQKVRDYSSSTGIRQLDVSGLIEGVYLLRTKNATIKKIVISR